MTNEKSSLWQDLKYGVKKFFITIYDIFRYGEYIPDYSKHSLAGEEQQPLAPLQHFDPPKISDPEARRKWEKSLIGDSDGLEEKIDKK